MNLLRLSLVIFLMFIAGFLSGFLFTSLEPTYTERSSPSDVLNSTDVVIFNNMACIVMGNLTKAILSGTNSMDPVLDEEAVVLRYKPKNISEINIGDIISFKYHNDTLIHRVIDIKDNKILTKGDNNKWNDGWIEFDKVVGKMVAVIY